MENHDKDVSKYDLKLLVYKLLTGVKNIFMMKKLKNNFRNGSKKTIITKLTIEI